MKQLELAERSGTSISMVSKILNGRRRASYELAETISEITKTDIELWIKGSAKDRKQALKAA